jgi:WhiB family redox-sensing transcriptional regulator
MLNLMQHAPSFEDCLPIPKWHRRAACRDADPEIFYLERGGRGGARGQAKHAAAFALCDRCPVHAECLEDRLSLPPGDDHGIAAGTTESERRALRRA